MLYHAGISNPDDELEFLTVTDYEKFTRDNNLYKEKARKNHDYRTNGRCHRSDQKRSKMQDTMCIPFNP